MEKVYLDKAKEYSSMKGFNLGAYSESRGLAKVRETIANHFKRRDGVDIELNDIYLTNGGMNAYDYAANLMFNPGEKVIDHI